MTDMQEKKEQTLTDIQGLQTIEQDLFDQLNGTDLTPEQKSTIITKINEVSQMRINLYNNLNSMYSFFGTNVSSSNAALAEQTIAIGIVEEQLNSAKEKLDEMQKNTNDNMRMIEINTYYGEKYSNYSDILKLSIIFCIPIIFFTVLLRGEIISRGIYSFFIIILFFFAIITIGIKILDASHRSNMNYNEYTWGFNKKTAPPVSSSPPLTSSDPWATAPSASIDCLGQNCCYEGTNYNAKLNQCVPNSYVEPTTTTTTATNSAATNSAAMGGSMSNSYSSSGLIQGGFGGL